MPDRNEILNYTRALWALSVRAGNDPLSMFEPLDYQEELWTSPKKDKVILGGNKSGKTRNGAAYVIDRCLAHANWRTWACTWADLSVPIQQTTVYEMLPKDGRIKYAKFSETTGFANRIILFSNGSQLRFKTYDQGWQSFQGAARNLIWDDEEPPEDVFKEQRMRLADRNGELLRTLTPLQGFTYTYDDVILNTHGNTEIAFWFWESLKNTYLNQEVLRNILRSYSPREAEVRSKGHFLNLRSGLMYYAYDRKRNKATERLKILPGLPIYLSFDFNINPMTTLIMQIVDGKKTLDQQDRLIVVYRVIQTPDTNTTGQCKILQALLSDYKNQLVIGGDATKPRRTEAAEVNTTNWTIVRSMFPQATFMIPEFNEEIVERVPWVNNKILNVDGDIGVLLNVDGCEPLERDFEQDVWDKSGKKKDSSSKMLNHASDAFDYFVSRHFKMMPVSAAYETKLITTQRTKRYSKEIDLLS